MKPVSVSIDVPDSRGSVYELLAVTAAHESFTDHMMRDWIPSGPDRGVGSRVHITAVMGGRREPVDIEVVEDVPPRRIVERNISAQGRRVATGSYVLDGLPGGGTRITFTYAWERAPLGDRLMAPLVRWMMRGGLEVAMKRLALELERRRAAAGPSAARG